LVLFLTPINSGYHNSVDSFKVQLCFYKYVGPLFSYIKTLNKVFI